MKDLISVIVPVYNAESTIERCIQSILAQTYEKFELILIDDGSIDNSLSICKSATNLDERVIVIHKKNGGVSSARNVGLDCAKGDYLIFVDSDDYIDQDMFETYIELMHRNCSDIIIGGLSVITSENQIREIKKPILSGIFNSEIWNMICNNHELYGYIGGKLFKMNIINEYKIRFNQEMYSQEDLDFCISYYAGCSKFQHTYYVGYQYVYIEEKRNPSYCDFIRNQLKMLQFAKENTQLNIQAENNVQNRICILLYVMLYEASHQNLIVRACQQLGMIDGLDEYLRFCKCEGEKKWIVHWYLNERYLRIQNYFHLREIIKRLLKRR